MSIGAIRAYHYRERLPVPVQTSLHVIEWIENVVVEIESDGMIGVGYSYCFEHDQARAIRASVDDLASSLAEVGDIGVRDAWIMMMRHVDFVGTGGIAASAIAAIDTALWDVHAQRAAMPLYRLLGGAAKELPAYATGGWTGQTAAEVAEDGLQLADEGFRQFKIKVGSRDWRTDVERVQAVKARVGDRLQIMVDANQAWHVHDAIAAGRAFETCDVRWFEEPVAARDIAGAAEVARALDLAVANGETLYGLADFRELVEMRGADVLTPDLMRCAGITGLLAVVSLAEAYRIPVASHAYAEISAHVLSASPAGHLLEWLPGWWDDMFDVRPRVENGVLTLSEAPGLGLVLSERVKQEGSRD